jgi:RimJ/RimL family protein N-acetyltransferase
MLGHIGFHTRPGEKYLEELAPGGVELGYTVFERERRQGYAREAAEGLMEWAHRLHGVTRFIVSISPANLASLELARRLGFRRIGSHVDEEDGPEDIFERRLGPSCHQSSLLALDNDRCLSRRARLHHAQASRSSFARRCRPRRSR